ncbi:hypothetical protein O0L34_g2414 [Tuta absoluta]|nr:hypothetical protein O0L34_g2414 [Tuta absoluta]
MDYSLVTLFSNVLSTLTILSCLFLKVPQIVSIRKKHSADGIYLQAMLMEITGFTIVTLYNFTNKYSLLTYMEYPIIMVQIYVMLFYVLKYKHLLDDGRATAVLAAVAGYVALVLAFAMQLLPKNLLSYVLPLCTPLSGFAKVTYVYGIVRARNADAVAPTTWVISVSTNVARLFTVYVDSADKTLMFNFAVSTILSASVLLTALYYQRVAAPSAAPGAAPSSRRRSKHSHSQSRSRSRSRSITKQHEHDD